MASFHSEREKADTAHPPLTMASSASTLRPEPAVELPQMGDGALSVHVEPHTKYGAVIHDAIIGFADGLTVPFALTAGLSSLGSSKLVIIGGLAELFSGAISMGLGAFLAAVTDREKYAAEEQREIAEVRTKPEAEKAEIYQIMQHYGVGRDACTPLVEALAANEDQWVQFMMDFELKLEKPKVSRAWISAGTMGGSYFIGGLIPMIPYFRMTDVTHALFVSIGITVVMLVLFGAVKNWLTIKTKRSAVYGAFQTLCVGVLAAGTSYGIVRGLDSTDPVHTG